MIRSDKRIVAIEYCTNSTIVCITMEGEKKEGKKKEEGVSVEYIPSLMYDALSLCWFVYFFLSFCFCF